MRFNFTLSRFLLVIFLISNLFAQDLKSVNNLMPVPENIIVTEGKFRLNSDFRISITGNPDERIYPAALRMLSRLAGKTGLFFPYDYSFKSSDAQMVLSVKRKGKIVLKEDESYSLLISDDKISLNSETDLGALRGMETFLQLLDADKDGYYFNNVNIEDKPRFAWRGLMMDVSRHFMPVEVIKRNLDGMAAVKMNVLHLHLSDDQGFRVECKTFPKLHQIASDGFYYTQEQIKEIIKYAAERGIRVYPEFDIPGHSTSWLVAYPELAALPGPNKIERKWGVFDPVFDPTKEAVYKFFDKFFGEMTALFPDEYFHIGGDENNGIQWNASKDIQAFMKKKNIPDNHSLQAYFNKRILDILTKNKKKMIGWEEIFHPDMPNNIVIHSWRGAQSLVDAAKKGYMSILSSGYYIDLMLPAEVHYLNDPIPANSNLSQQELEKILGGETTMWAEMVSPDNVDSRIWPRTAAIAERFWSPSKIRDVNDMYRRLDIISFRLEELGLTQIKNQDVLLRRLTNNNNTIPLKNLVDVIEPIEFYERGNQGLIYTSFSPLTRTVDAALADAMKAREFRILTNEFLSGKKENQNRLKDMLFLWKDNHNELLKIIEVSPVLKEIELMSLNLSLISPIGLEAVNYIIKNEKASEQWMNEKLKVNEDAKKNYGQAEIVITSAIEKLIKAAAGIK